MNIDERIELFRDGFQRLIQESGLSVSVLYYIVSGFYQDIKQLYTDHQQEVISSINKQLNEQRSAETNESKAQEES